ncbi:MAG: hypothetical protein ORN50_02255 [Crocinitomicaceae bacterium]|nr:hypothetical protein [Crocinitomicaceae bacterium]
MGIFSSIFGSEKKLTVAEIYNNYSCDILKTINLPVNDANRLKASVYLLFAQLASIHVISNGTYQQYMDGMVEDVKNSVKPLSMKAGALATSNEELKKILSDFPAQASVDKDTKINGLAGFNGIYFPFVSEVVTDIGKHTGGPMGVHGYAAIRVLEGLRGKGKSEENFMEVTFKLTEMTNDLIHTLR